MDRAVQRMFFRQSAHVQCIDPEKQSLRILGIDPSLTSTGIAVLWGGRLRTWTIGMDAGNPMKRLVYFRDELTEIVERYGIRAAIIEGYSFGSRFTRSHAAGELGGVIRLVLHDMGVHTVSTPPKTMKQAISGDGNADKKKIMLSLKQNMGLQLTQPDEADAAALSVIGAHFFCSAVDTAALPGITCLTPSKKRQPFSEVVGPKILQRVAR